MQLSTEKVEQFQRMYHARYGIELSEKQAREQGAALITFLETVMKQHEVQGIEENAVRR